MKANADTIIRSIMLIIALINQILSARGITPIPMTEDSEKVYAFLSSIAAGIISLWAWWKNNSFTKNAVEADDYLHTLRRLDDHINE